VHTDRDARLAAVRTVEITTTGRRTGRPSRVEIWWFRFEGRFVITGTPGRRDWLANLRADPQLVVHALGADHPATAVPIEDAAFRRRFFTQSNAEMRWYVGQAELVELVETAPMIEVRLTDR
jgi:deazaflavin-dependent oxidoreductase (nitroreductase family)